MENPSDERFEIVRELGHGGFAVTYLVRIMEPELAAEWGESLVAIKMPVDRHAERMLRREMELNAGLHMRLKQLRAPNIVRYLGFEMFRGRLVMVMEYVAQGNLRRRMGGRDRGARIPSAEACRIIEGVLHGLSLIHREQVFHRDIKPENILMAGDTPKIADLGIARLLDAGQRAVTQAGTLPYMSPEILSEHGGSYSSDLWATGVTLYEMITGRLPFGDAETPIRRLVELISYAEHRPAHEVNPEVPRPLSAFLDRALRKDPAQRFSSADEMCHALELLSETGEDDELTLPQGEAGVDQELVRLRGWMEDLGRAAAVEARLRELIQERPSDHRAYECLGELLARRQRHAEAARVLQRGAELAPGQATLHWHLALALQGAGDRRGAAAAIRRALDLGLPDRIRGHASLLMRALDAQEKR